MSGIETTGAAERLSTRNLYAFAIGTFGRDLACAGLFMGQLMNYVYFTKHLTNGQFAVLTVLVVLAKIFDAINDPVMGNIVDATRSKWGKFKPWMFVGMIGSSIVIIASFANNLQGWAYVGFFGAMYFLWSIVFTMNDISYWGMIPALARNAGDRNKLSSVTSLFAGVGGTICSVLVPVLTTGNLAINGSAVFAYAILSIIFVAVFLVIQSITIFFVKESPAMLAAPSEKIGIKRVLGVYKNNDQLLWMTLIFLLTQLLPSTAIPVYIYMQFGYQGVLTTLIYVFGGIATLLLFLFYPRLSAKLCRAKLLQLSLISALAGFGMMLLFGIWVPETSFSIPIPVFNVNVTLQFFLMMVANLFCMTAQTCITLIFVISIANTVEYNEWKTGKRDEGIIFSTRSFLVKFGGAFSILYVMLFYMLIGIKEETDTIADLEQAANLGTITGAEKMERINDIIADVSFGKKLGLLIFITVIPMALYLAAYCIYKKKYFISETYYAYLIKKIAVRNADDAAPEQNRCE
jgi:melibiose permease/lactose/raffinose/galactose permease